MSLNSKPEFLMTLDCYKIDRAVTFKNTAIPKLDLYDVVHNSLLELQ